MSLPNTGADASHLDKKRATLLLRIGGGLAALGVVASLLAAFADPHRFAFSYLTSFVWFITIGLGGLFFVLIQHLTRAAWSVAPRRQAEWLSGLLPLGAVLFIPIVFFAHELWEHWMGAAALVDPILQKKSGYLNPTFFYIRAAFFFAAWTGLVLLFNRASRRQDENGDPNLTVKMQSWSAPATLIFALTLTFAAFDWLMSLDPHWYSTIFGVYVFAGSVTSSLALIALLTIGLQRAGLLHKVSTIEHRHDLGKLLFGFTIFWAYIAFSQFFLIWYANIPEETIFFVHRWTDGWKSISLVLLFGHFWLPFAVLLSRHAKRSMLVLGLAAAWHLVMHWVDIFWIVMPSYDHHGHVSWIDLAAWLGTIGIIALWLAVRASRDPLYPLKDPRLAEAMQVVNL